MPQNCCARFARGLLVAAFVALSLSSSVLAQDRVGPADPEIPAPETVNVPAITGGRDAAVVSDGWKYFYFYRANTSYREAYADLAECYRFLPVANAQGALPFFAPWDAKPGTSIRKPPIGPDYGIVGNIILDMIASTIDRRAHQSRMRRCMEPRGYQRYPLREDVWKKIVDGYSTASIAVQAKIVAMGPPDAEPLPETR